MNTYYQKFLKDISLSSDQIEDGRTKYKGVCDCLAHAFYDRDLQDSDKLVFGSFKTCTQVLPMGNHQDVDVVFKVSKETYEQYQNQPGAMLQKVRSYLKDKYTTTDKISAWGKVVLVDFSDGHHDVEVAPCYEDEYGIFYIPNTCKSEVDWEAFDVRGQIDAFQTSNDATHNLTRELVKILKKWIRNTSTLKYSSFNLMNDVIRFVSAFYPEGRCNTRYDIVVKDFFTFMNTATPSHLQDYKSHLETAKNRAVNATQFEEDGKHIEATEECIKIFGNDFPKAQKNDKRDSSCSTVLPVRPWGVN